MIGLLWLYSPIQKIHSTSYHFLIQTRVICLHCPHLDLFMTSCERRYVLFAVINFGFGPCLFFDFIYTFFFIKDLWFLMLLTSLLLQQLPPSVPTCCLIGPNQPDVNVRSNCVLVRLLAHRPRNWELPLSTRKPMQYNSGWQSQTLTYHLRVCLVFVPCCNILTPPIYRNDWWFTYGQLL